MKKVILLSIAISFMFTSIKSQEGNWCITDKMDNEVVKENPEILVRRAQLEKFTQEYIRGNYRTGEKVIIPVVFHIIHNYGDENISKDAVVNAIETINEDYRAQNTEIGHVVPDFQGLVADCNFEFRLAKLDPDGNLKPIETLRGRGYRWNLQLTSTT